MNNYIIAKLKTLLQRHKEMKTDNLKTFIETSKDFQGKKEIIGTSFLHHIQITVVRLERLTCGFKVIPMRTTISVDRRLQDVAEGYQRITEKYTNAYIFGKLG